MSYSKILVSAVIGLAMVNVSVAFADNLKSESEFINKTLLGNWKAQTVSKNDEVRNVDISKDRFMDNILGKFKIVTKENQLAERNVDSSLKRYTEQFGHAKKS
ncbi:hypothetical protein [Methylophilus sp. TWE2]|jgi:hypothetical protein|uniref:hypothetical protein n=1 Tax=Methylophilus sp. TWE2 TaxID=1662285 RepID=UPI0006716D5E|nr:hypothetical protein [Methylophilus sp. TWE2]AKR43958.1 hypothetical protein ACJ67_11455 [Methylophilus sp. TWE2]